MYNRYRRGRTGYTNWFQLIVVFALGMFIGQLFNIELALEPRTEPTEQRTR